MFRKPHPRRRGPATTRATRQRGPPASARNKKSDPQVAPHIYPEGPFEFFYNALFGNPDSKWGALKWHVREARKEGRWQEWSIRDIADAVPAKESDDDARGRYDQASAPSKYRIADEMRLDIRPAQADFEGLLRGRTHAGDYDDEFFRVHYANLYVKTVECVKRWFGDINFAGMSSPTRKFATYQSGIWDMNLTPQFIEYARLVAIEDHGLRGWPAIIDEPHQRVWLIVGIIGQIMEKKIFNELLFGADETTEDELGRLDRRYINKEGYDRKAVRSVLARYGVEGRLLPNDFYPKIDDLAARTVDIFLPLLNVFKLFRSQDMKLEYFLQEIHYLLSYAGMIQICMSVSPSIFHFLSATPGARMDYPLEEQADMDLYHDSQRHYREEDKKWNEAVNGARPGSTIMVGNEPVLVPDDDSKRRTMNYHRIRGAKIKFAVFPKVTRYKPENKGKGGPDPRDDPTAYRSMGMPGEHEVPDIEGQSIIEISKCKVVYYQGLIYPREDYVEAMTLDEHLYSIFSPPNGLIGLIDMLVSPVLYALRRLIWHILVIGAVFGLIYSTVVGREFIWYLGRYWAVPIVWLAMMIFFISRSYLDSGDELWAWGIAVIPFLTIYAIGFYYTYTGIEPPPRNPRDTWIAYFWVHDFVVDRFKELLVAASGPSAIPEGI
ncbi:hypothetical protein F4677DRAFT_176649 [Hypoxylon crocopeplum]|nr:hypothetical protein F4677DRAFT_176649 [Hypoxylon crocopeplum]